MFPADKFVFISCGQVTEEEKSLGRTIAQLVEDLTPFKAYLAQNQSSLQGLTENILRALNECAGIIVIMHPRGRVKGLQGAQHTRGSVWIEQEIAIAAFLTQVVHKELKVAAFVHKDVQREGMRDELQLNPVVFETNEQVLIKLLEILRRWKEDDNSLRNDEKQAS
jgi:hypothetical protein